MNPLTFRTLEEAFAGRAPVPAPKPIPPIEASPPLPEIVITGPINRVMELEGKRWATDFVQALGASIRREPTRTKAIADLTRYAAAQPSSRASGVKIVIDMLKGA
ncbi:hypothetical protein [Pseudomonas chlororaphis]|uniref:hypothetical protein n=1 Tax=Pseudomonas chlororaphis TaxID=587753 RepID=UPI000F550DC3|nr:hypothetical protein [Pseudomonas chlororaphis]AZD50548.1 hypothetical protein C4K20_5157 [Pseudomonas chlororaphis subsp. aurantiaca]